MTETSKILSAMILLGAVSATPSSAATPAQPENTGVKVEFISPNHSLIRINSDDKYLLLPIEESQDDAKIEIIVNGKLEKVVNARLAKNKVDYMVPLDLSGYDNKGLVLAVETRQGRSTTRDIQNDACWKALELTNEFESTNTEKFRPEFHHTPLWGWMNDPNGMFYKDGVWHLYYQWNPYGSKWQNLSWGHSTSTDLVNWKHETSAALEPDALGMIFSGSSVVDKNNTAGFGEDAVIALYTAAAATQQQSLAWSTDDGTTLNPYSGNPVITLDSEARDPNMFWHEPTQHWVLLLAHALEHEMLILTSPDLKEWTLQSSFGKGLGAQDGVWECPDLLKVKVDGSDKEKWVLICNLNPGGVFGGSATQYFVGDFDGKTFTPDTDAEGKVPTKWMDFGKDHYATVSFSNAPDGRNTVIGWMSNWQYAPEVPTMQFRSANTLPREVGLFEGADGQLYASSTPSPEVETMRGSVFKRIGGMSAGTKAKSVAIPDVCEIVLTLKAGKAAGNVNLTLENNAGERVVMTYDPTTKTLSFDRTNSGITDFSQDFPAVTVAPTFNEGKESVELRIFVDRSSIEVFEKDGRFAMTNLVFPNEPYSRLTVNTDKGSAEIKNLTIYDIKKN